MGIYELKSDSYSTYVAWLGYLYFTLVIVLFIGPAIDMPVGLSITLGSSMYPSIKTGDLAVLVSSTLMKPKKGEVASYITKDHTLVLHRIIDVRGNIYYFKGDNNPFMDPPIPRDKFLYVAPYIMGRDTWIPLFSIVSTTIAILPQLITYKEIRRYNAHSLFLFIIFSLLTTAIGTSLFEDEGYSVKPNPVVKITSISKVNPDTYKITLSHEVSNVTCTGGICTLEGNTILLEPQSSNVTIRITLPNRLKVYEVIPVSIGR